MNEIKLNGKDFSGKELVTIEKKGTKYKRGSKKFSPTEIPNNDRVKESIDFAKKFDNVKDRVKSIIKSDKYSRKNYLWLDILYYVKCGQIKLIVPLEEFQKANSPETINRAFRKLIEETSKGLHPDLKYLLKEEVTEFEQRQKQKEKIEGMLRLETNSKRAKILK